MSIRLVTHYYPPQWLRIEGDTTSALITLDRVIKPGTGLPADPALLAEARAYMASRPVFTGDLSTHEETGPCAVTHLADGWTIVGTDRALIGGMEVRIDGSYVIYDGHISGQHGPQLLSEAWAGLDLRPRV